MLVSTVQQSDTCTVYILLPGSLRYGLSRDTECSPCAAQEDLMVYPVSTHQSLCMLIPAPSSLLPSPWHPQVCPPCLGVCFAERVICVCFSCLKFYWSAVALPGWDDFRRATKGGSNTHPHPFFSRFFSHIGGRRILSRVPCALRQVPGTLQSTYSSKRAVYLTPPGHPLLRYNSESPEVETLSHEWRYAGVFPQTPSLLLPYKQYPLEGIFMKYFRHKWYGRK